MTALDLIHSEAAQRLLERASRAAGLPMSLHFVERNQEGPLLASWGACEACRYVASLEGGRRACRQSRLTAASMALRQRRALPFICHMGFVCVVIPALPGESFALVLGPYCPADEPRSLEHDACAGLAELTGEEGDQFPVSLDDIHRAPATAAPAVAEWTVEALSALWQASHDDEAEPEAEEEAPGPARPKRRPVHLPAAYAAADVAAALAGGNQPQARELLRGVLDESKALPRRKHATRRARAIAAVAAALEAAEHAGLQCETAWAAMPQLIEAVREATQSRELLDAAMAVLGIVRRRAVPRRKPAESAAPATAYAELNRILASHFEEGITLEDVARQLGESPSAISHRLRRKFDMSYSEYLGRLRVDKAKELLRRTKLSATEVARRVGIRDQSNFGKLFRRYEGMSPIEYRRRFASKS